MSMPCRIIRSCIVQSVKWHELIARLVKEAGGSLPVAKAMRAESFQGTLHKIAAGRVEQPSRASAERIANHFRIPVDALYDDAVASSVFAERFGGEATTEHFSIASGDHPGEKDPAQDLHNALQVIQSRLALMQGDGSARAAEALRLLAMTPDSARAFNAALSALGGTGPAAPSSEMPSVIDERIARELALSIDDDLRQAIVLDFLERLRQEPERERRQRNDGQSSTALPGKIHTT